MINLIWERFGLNRSEKRPEVIVIEVPPLMRRGEYGDVIAFRHPLGNFRKFTNVPYVMGNLAGGGQDFEWGYSGTGPMNFSFNILLHFTDQNEAVARAYHIDFCLEFLTPMPASGGRISKNEIFEFIERMKASKPEVLAEVIRDMGLDQR